MQTDEKRGTFEALDQARRLRATLRDAQPQIEASRALPPALARQIKEAGLFRMLLPRSLGGAQLELPRFMRVVEAIAEADGSTGWCVSQGAVFPALADALDPELARAVWVDDPLAVVATGAPRDCTATRHAEGYELTGHWRFASGIQHADWVAAMASAQDRNGNPLPPCVCVLPRSDVTLLDGWNVRGMRGTGSREYELDRSFVPTHRVFPMATFLGHPSTATGLSCGLLFACGFGAVGSGIARRALDEFGELARGKTPALTQRKLVDDDLVQAGFAKAEAQWGALRGFLLDVAEECAWVHAKTGTVDEALQQRMRLASTHAMRASAEVVDQVYELAGSDTVFDDHPIHHCFQDVHALTQQIQARPSNYRAVGRHLLGLEPDPAMGPHLAAATREPVGREPRATPTPAVRPTSPVEHAHTAPEGPDGALFGLATHPLDLPGPV